MLSPTPSNLGRRLELESINEQSKTALVKDQTGDSAC